MNALELLTEHCWEEILDRVEEPADLKNCSESCLTFHEILKTKKCEFMFQLILPHILKSLTQTADEQGALQPTSYKALFNCRLVCRSWCDSIEKLETTSRIPYSPHRYLFNSGEKIERFLQTFGTDKRNPFIGRRVGMVLGSPQFQLLTPNNAEDQNRARDPREALYMKKVRRLLDRFGNEIWTMTLCEPWRLDRPHLGFCKNIQTALGYLPKLRSLELLGSLSRFWNRSRMTGVWEELDQLELAGLPPYIASHPLPPLPYLEHLQIDSVSVMMTSFLLEAYSPQLKSLSSSHLTRFPEQLPRMSNLQELELARLDADDSLEVLGQLRSPLQKLGLTVAHNQNDVGVWAIDELFLSTGHLPIQTFELEISKVFLGESGTVSPVLRIRNESIHEIRINSRSGVSLNFLLSCLNLASLDITLVPSLQDGHPNGIAELLDITQRTREAEPDLYQSNIWELVPSLEVLDVYCMTDDEDNAVYSYSHYTKKRYEERKRLGNNSLLPSPTLSSYFNSMLDFILDLFWETFVS